MPLTGQIVLYGGSFDPPSIGHSSVCLLLLQALNAQEVILVPTFDHPNKKAIANFNHRVQMCSIISKIFKTHLVSVSNIEQTLPVPSRTINTIRHYACANLAFAIGSDLANDIEKWYEWDEIKTKARIVVIGRPGFQNNNGLEYYNFSSSIADSNMSSSNIRQMIKDNKDITGMVPSKVKQYIIKNGLYV